MKGNRVGTCVLGAVVLCAASAGFVHAEHPRTQNDKNSKPTDDRPTTDTHKDDEVIVIEGDAPYTPVASRSVRERDLRLRPKPRPADILRVVPGLFVNQHAGGGKANQYFLRGFDADHGTDVALSVDGVPVNMVSHGHGQGYADLNWVIPELVQGIDVFKGPYSAALGDFATAGAVDMVTRDRAQRSSLSATIGRFDTYRLLGVTAPITTKTWRSLFASEAYFTNGPFDSGESYLRYNAWARLVHETPRHSVSLSLTSYGGGWNGSGQLPLREVDAGRLNRFGSLDPTEGGNSARQSAYVTYHGHPDDRSEVSLLAYLVSYRLSIYSNFTFFAVDPTFGDQIEQVDDRVMTGLAARYRFSRKLGTLRFDTTLGTQVRSDDIDNALYHTQRRTRLSPGVDAHVNETSIGMYAQEDIRWTGWLRTVIGVRGDYFGFQVTDRLDPFDPNMTRSGVRERAIVSPKGSLVISPAKRTDVYLNFGTGFHSNDARAVVARPQRGTPLARALGYEVGARSRLFGRVDLAGSVWLLDLDSETVWVGDEGVTEARGRTRRYGVDVEVRAQLLPWLVADADVTFARARFRDLPKGQDRVPLAPRYTVTAGVSILHPRGVFGRLGLRSLSNRPLVEDNELVAPGFTLIDASAGYRTPRYEVFLAVDNVFNARWSEAQFATTSRLASDPPLGAPPPANACPAGTRVGTDDMGNFAGCEDNHFTPGTPLNLMLTMRLFF